MNRIVTVHRDTIIGAALADYWFYDGTDAATLMDSEEFRQARDADMAIVCRRPRKIHTRYLRKRLMRDLGFCIEGDSCRVPQRDEYIQNVDTYQRDNRFAEGIFNTVWNRRWRTRGVFLDRSRRSLAPRLGGRMI